MIRKEIFAESRLTPNSYSGSKRPKAKDSAQDHSPTRNMIIGVKPTTGAGPETTSVSNYNQMNQSTKMSQRESIFDGGVGTTVSEPIVHEESQEEQTVSPRDVKAAATTVNSNNRAYEHSFGAAGFFKSSEDKQ